MDSGDIKNIEKAVQNVKEKVDDVKKDVVNKMDDIEEVLKTTKSRAGRIESNTNNISSANDKLEKIVKINSDILQKIQGMGKPTASTATGVSLTDVDLKLKTIISHQINIDTNTSTITGAVMDMNGSIKDATEYLRLLKEHIVDGNASKNSVKPSVSNADTKDSISSISKNVAAIVTILEDIRNNTITSSEEGDQDELKRLIRKNAIAREKEIDDKNEYKRISEKDKKKRTEKEKKYLKAYERREKNRKKEEERANGKRGGSATAGKIISGVDSIIKEPKVANLANAGVSALSNVNPLVGAIAGLIKSVVELGSKQDRATSEFARAIGGGRFGKVNAGDTVSGMVRNMPLNRGYTSDAAYSAITEVAEARGRTTERMSKENLMSAIDLKRFGISADAINNFDTFGKSLEETDRYFAKLYGEVSKKGLSFKNVSKAVNDNLKQAQSHNFANGLRGLEQMAEKSVQLKYNMQQVFTLADKVSEIEGAISTAANLSVLGGQFAQFSNPMQLLYEGLNDMEALNDRMVKMFSGKAHWDEEKGEMTMDSLQKEFVRQAAKAAGLDPNEMLNLSFNEAKMNRISSRIMPGLDKDTAEYIKNIAELDKKGNPYVTLNGETKKVSELTDKDREMLEKESRAKDVREGAKLGDIYQETMSVGETLDNILKYLQEQLGRWVFALFNRFAARENNRQTTAQGEGKKELQQKRLDYYRLHSSEHFGGWFSPSKKSRKNFAKEVAGMTEAELDAALGNTEGKSPGGFAPTRTSHFNDFDFLVASLVPGYGLLRGMSHLYGGIKGRRRGQAWEAEGDEFLVNKNSSLRYYKELSQIQNGTFNPYSYANSIVKNDMNRHYMPMQVSPLEREMLKAAYKPANSNQPNTISGTIKVDIPQRITIDIAGGNKIGDYDISSVIAKYVDSFMKEMMLKSYSGFNKEEFHTKTVV